MKIKLTIILPLYLASIIMLAFTVFPHHHHENFICFNAVHCQQTTSTHQGCSHEHDPFSADEGCVKHLFQTEITKSLSLNHTCEDGYCHHFTLSIFLPANIINPLWLETLLDILPDTSYHEKLHAARYAVSKPTRAPPIF